MRLPLATATTLLAAGFAHAAVTTIPHAEVTCEGADAKWAKAMAETMAAARIVYLDEFACDMPDTVHGRLSVKAGESTRLYTDGRDHLFLSLPSESKLAAPAKSGVFNLYGMCHELGHMAMYRVLRDRDWMTGDAAEGWAHYAGSVVIDRVFDLKGDSLWPDPYDYRADGTARLTKQLASASPDGVTVAAGQWQKLGEIVGRKGYAKLFIAWQAIEVDLTKPAESLLASAVRIFPDHKEPLTQWWTQAAKLFVKTADASAFQATTITASRLTGKPVVLASDDDRSDGKKSIAGGGHARRFAVPDDGEWYIRTVTVCGAQYGRAKNAMFDVALCDTELRPVATWKKPYTAFRFGDLQWTRLPVTPTRVPREFCICLVFRPTATQGVYVGFDNSTQGESLVGVPGEPGRDFVEGDWMIRVELDQPKDTASRPAR
ncbi:MAG: hypothetical protein GXY55_08875 [Phycisphaerae bacterium]|nr:hypothetical protein [Phycisphaerae bacterium]